MTTTDMPRDVQLTLYRALVWSRLGSISPSEQAAAWAWLEQNTPQYEEMGQ